jgi:hypothetical protein
MRAEKKLTHVMRIVLVIAVNDVQYKDNPSPARGP